MIKNLKNKFSGKNYKKKLKTHTQQLIKHKENDY